MFSPPELEESGNRIINLCNCEALNPCDYRVCQECKKCLPWGLGIIGVPGPGGPEEPGGPP